MGDKDELISSISTSLSEKNIHKSKGNKMTDTSMNSKIAESSFVFPTTKICENIKGKGDVVLCESSTPPESEHHGHSSSTLSSKLPNLYHKFVESFEAVIQNLTADGRTFCFLT